MNFVKIASIPKSPLRRRAAAAALACALAWGMSGSYAQAPANKMSFDTFRMVQTRNIFDPERSRDLVLASSSSAHSLSSGTTGSGSGAPPPVVNAGSSDYVVLTGIMMTEDQTLAFFAGSQPEYNKVIALKGSIAGATITKITPSSIDVQRNGKQVTVLVGQTVPFDDSAPGLPPASSPAAPQTAAPSPAIDPQGASQQVPLPDVTTGAPKPSSPPPAGDTSDVMRRMMERRQKQLQ
jgi:hypothetical protein